MSEEEKVPFEEDQGGKNPGEEGNLPLEEGEGNESPGEEEYQFSDEDIDRELSELDDANLDDMDGGEVEVEVDPDSGEASGEQSAQAEAEPAPSGRFGGLVAKLKQFNFKNLSRKQVTIIFGVLVVIVFFMMKSGGSSSKSTASNFGAKTTHSAPLNQLQNTKVTQQSARPVQQQPAYRPVQQQPAQTEYQSTSSMFGKGVQKTSQPKASSQSPGMSQEVEKQMSSMNEANQHLLTQVNVLANRVTSLESNISGINNKLTLIADKMTSNASSQRIEPRMQAQQSQQPTMQQRSEPKQAMNNRSMPNRTASRAKYTVEAVVPGRAWLQSNVGETMSVAVGDVVPGFGQVAAINAYNGNVTTTAGVVIKYGSGV